MVGRESRFDPRPLAEQASRDLSEGPCHPSTCRDQDETFGNQLPQEFAAPCAKREPKGELTLSACIARQQQHDHVGQCYQQHKSHHGHQDVEWIRVLRIESGKALCISEAQYRRLLALHWLAAQADKGGGLKPGLQLRYGLSLAYARSEPSDDLQAPPGWIVCVDLAVL